MDFVFFMLFNSYNEDISTVKRALLIELLLFRVKLKENNA